MRGDQLPLGLPFGLRRRVPSLLRFTERLVETGIFDEARRRGRVSLPPQTGKARLRPASPPSAMPAPRQVDARPPRTQPSLPWRSRPLWRARPPATSLRLRTPPSHARHSRNLRHACGPPSRPSAPYSARRADAPSPGPRERLSLLTQLLGEHLHRARAPSKLSSAALSAAAAVSAAILRAADLSMIPAYRSKASTSRRRSSISPVRAVSASWAQAANSAFSAADLAASRLSLSVSTASAILLASSTMRCSTSRTPRARSASRIRASRVLMSGSRT